MRTNATTGTPPSPTVPSPGLGRTWPRRLLLATAVGLVGSSIGCATVRSKRVADSKGTVVQQKEGLPYYLPRPYVAVKQPFPVYGIDMLVQGTVSKTGEIQVDTKLLPPEIRPLLVAGTHPTRLQVPGATVRVAQQSTAGSDAADSNSSGSGKAGSADGEDKEAAKDEEKEGEDKGEEAEKTEAKGTVSTEGTTSPVVRVSDLFDVVYLPDFTEKYVLRLRPRLGKLEASIPLQGGMLGGLNVNIDNTAIATLLTDVVKTAADVAKEIALGKLLPDKDATDEMMEGLKQQATDDRKPVSVTLRVRYAAEALPGLYPVLKPDEEQDGNDVAGTVFPISPFFRVAYRVRHTLDVQLLRSSPQTTQLTTTTTVLKNLKAVNKWVKDAGLDKQIGEVTKAVMTGKVLTLTLTKKLDAKASADIRKKLSAKLPKLAEAVGAKQVELESK